MKWSTITPLFAAGALACAQTGRPPTASSATAPTSADRTETAQVSESAPLEPGIPTNAPAVHPPTPALGPAEPTAAPLSPASGNGSPRSVSAQLVPDPARDQAPNSRDQAATARDRESLREMRALFASDPALAPIANQITIVARDGRVWLRGQVNTTEQRTALEKAARQAAWVLNVNNELVVME
jgi:hypothetical protein